MTNNNFVVSEKVHHEVIASKATASKAATSKATASKSTASKATASKATTSKASVSKATAAKITTSKSTVGENAPNLSMCNSNSGEAVEVKETEESSIAPPHPLHTVIHNYLTSLGNIGETVQVVMPHLSKWYVEEFKKNQKKLSALFEKKGDGEDGYYVFRSAREYVEYATTSKKLENLQEGRALSVLARSLFTQVFCEFDAFTGELLKVIYLRNPELLKNISRDISFVDLLQFGDIEAIKLSMLDKEIETFRRDSYIEQFAHLEKKFGLTLRKFPEWGEFVELGQRRNIFGDCSAAMAAIKRL